MRRTRWCLGLLLLSGLASPASADPPPLVRSAFSRAAESVGGGAYTRTSVENRVKTVERFDPRKDWTLVSINDKSPSKKQLKKYASRSDSREDRDHPDAIDFTDIVDVDSVVLVTESATTANYRFKPKPDENDEDDASEHLEGTMAINKTGPFVEWIALENVESFSPATGVKIDEMRVRMEFEVDAHGRIVMRELRQDVAGRLFGIKRLTQQSTVTFSEFGPQTVSP